VSKFAAAIERVRASTRQEQVIARAAAQRLRAAGAAQGIGKGRTNQHLGIGDRIACGIAANIGCPVKPRAHACVRSGIV